MERTVRDWQKEMRILARAETLLSCLPIASRPQPGAKNPIFLVVCTSCTGTDRLLRPLNINLQDRYALIVEAQLG
jgi:hypothetical protein